MSNDDDDVPKFSMKGLFNRSMKHPREQLIRGQCRRTIDAEEIHTSKERRDSHAFGDVLFESLEHDAKKSNRVGLQNLLSITIPTRGLTNEFPQHSNGLGSTGNIVRGVIQSSVE